jgi:asparagine synthase (glutamine-hydrolysing)
VSAQFGRWNIDGLRVDQDYLAKAGQMLAPFGPDGGSTYIKDSVGILFRAFPTTKESRKETQPFVTPSGAVLCWDGRLDNREELIGELRETTTADTDLSFVAGAWAAWGTQCFAKLIGDWALSIWDPARRSLILAKDPIGTKPLYYSLDQKQITWSTILDPLVLLAGKSFTLEEEYIAGWLSFFPATHLTPYVGIHSVPPSCFVRIEHGQQTVSKYWDFDPSKRIRYRTDREYEEHFRQVFAQSVTRRLRSDSPILAELSGGMDSSSIVCMADTIIARGAAETPRLDTVSYYDDSEPNWNERPYFAKVEEKRGRIGCRIDTGSMVPAQFEFDTTEFAAAPSPNSGSPTEAGRQFLDNIISQGNRVVLSGIGGDEVTGGVPTPAPELENLIARARYKALVHQLRVWALNKKKPWFHLFFEAAQGFLPFYLVQTLSRKPPVPWLKRCFIKRNREALNGYQRRLQLFGSLPSFQDNVSALDALRRQLACSRLPSQPPYEKRYIFLDQNLLEFIFAIPREQLVRPGHRRSLMRRALVGIVPQEILERKRKAYVSRRPLVDISSQRLAFVRMNRNMACASIGIVDTERFSEALKLAEQGGEVSVVTLLRTIAIEGWLRNLATQRVCSVLPKEMQFRLAPTVISADKT